MPDISIAILAQDKHSSTLNTMAKITKSFRRGMNEMEETLGRRNKNKCTLKMDLKDAPKQPPGAPGGGNQKSCSGSINSLSLPVRV